MTLYGPQSVETQILGHGPITSGWLAWTSDILNLSILPLILTLWEKQKQTLYNIEYLQTYGENTKCYDADYSNVEMIDPEISAVVEECPTVPPDTTTVEAAQLLRKTDVPALVVREGGDIVGIVRESDVVALVAEQGGNERVETYMSAPVVTTSSSVTVTSAADRMQTAGVSCLPVVDDGTYMGVVTPDLLAPYVSRNRLDIECTDETLTLDSAQASGVPGD